jgi:transcriptional regulator with XRE-family HTH domain|nr:MAG TPA: helix-turn-helix domain protein [Caudoviricetes sp.]
MCKINGKKLGELRTKAGVSQKELAKELGMSVSTVQNYEYGKSEPSTDIANRICMFLKINRGEIEIHDVGYDFTHGESKVVGAARKRLKDRRYRKPSLVNAFILENKKKSEEEELSEIESKLIPGQSIIIAGKKYIQIDPTLIHIPTWQRDTDFATAEEISINFDENQFDPIKVYIKNGKLYVADGAHRLIAFILRNISMKKQLMILVEVLNCDEEEARKVFLAQKKGRKTMSNNDMYRAAVEENEPDYVAFRNICKANDIQIPSDEEIIDNPIGSLNPSSVMLRMAKKENELMNKIVALIKDLNWTGSSKNAITPRNIKVIKKLYANNKGINVEEKMLQNCKGASFYEAKVLPVKNDAELYDILSTEISK